MRAGLYRDVHDGIRARLAELAARIRERERELTDAFWTNLEPYVRERLADLRKALGLIGAESLDALARAEVLLSAYAAELEGWLSRARELEEQWLETPSDVDDPPAVPESGPRLSATDGEAFLSSFVAAIREGAHDDVELVADGWWSCVARFRRREAPFVLRASAIPAKNGQLGDVAMQLVTSVARATPPLLVRHESLLMAVTKAMGRRDDLAVGDASFDGLFLVQGASADARRVLVPKVRALLLALAHFDVPTLEIDPPHRTASLTWFFEPDAEAIDAAVRTLSVIRETPATVSFRRRAG